MRIFRRKFIWSNPQAMLLKGNKSLSSQEGHIWTQAKFKDVIWEVQPYHFCYWISPVLFRSHFFVRRTKSAIVILAVYVDNILLIGSDSPGLLETKRYLKRHFVTKDMEHPKYFLGIEVAHQEHSILLSQWKYALNLLKEACLLGCKSATIPMEANVDLWFDDSHALDDPGRYRRLIEKLIYTTITRPNINFVVRVFSRFMHQLRETHWLAAIRVLAYIKNCPEKGLMYRKHEHLRISRYLNLEYAGNRGNRKSTIGIALLLEKIWWLGVKNRMLCLARVQKLGIELWLIRHARLCG